MQNLLNRRRLLSSLLIGLACQVQAIELNEWLAEVGYRQDHASFDVSATLSDADHAGIGNTRYRAIRIAEFGLQGEIGFTPRFIGRGELKFGVIFNGQMHDSGLADITSNPCNSAIASFYGLCDTCPEDSCLPCCPGLPFLPVVPSSGEVRGTVWDLQLGLGAVFNPHPLWAIVPLVGYQFDQQRYRWTDSVWGPLDIERFDSLCTSVSAPAILTTPCCEVLLEAAQEPCCSLDPSPFACLGFGGCLDGTVYRARWNTGWLGLEFNWTPLVQWHLSASYAFHYGGYAGLFDTSGASGIDGRCGCCPVCLSSCANSVITEEPFASVQLTASAPAIGHQVILATDWSCQCHQSPCTRQWLVGLQASWNTRTILDCEEMDPCASCTLTCTETGSSRPIWQQAWLQAAQWTSWDLLLTVGRFF